MKYLLAASLLLLLQGGETLSIPRSPLKLPENKSPVLQRILLSDVSNMQLNNGRHFYFGASPELVGTLDVNSTENQEDGKSKMGTEKTLMTSTVVDDSQSTKKMVIKNAQNSVKPFLSTVVSTWKQFPTLSHDQASQDIQFAVNPVMNKVLSPLKEASANSSQTSLGAGATNSNITTFRGEKISIFNQLPFGESTTFRSNHVSDDTILLSTGNSSITTHETERIPPDTTNNTNVFSQTTTENSTIVSTQSPTCKTCTENPGLIAAIVVLSMALVVLIMLFLSLYYKRILLTFASMCRCTKYTLV